VISDYLKLEVQLGRLQVVPTSKGPAPPLLQVSPFGVIPKKHKPNKWRLIVDLSSPQGQSVNDAIPADLCSVSYTSVDDAVSMMQKLSDSCLMAKVDIQEAYRAVPVHPSDQRFLGLSWEGTTFIDKVLPFGLRSAPKLFSALTDAMMWMLHDRGVVNAIHYLDDFLLLGPPGSPTCSQALSTTLGLCAELGFTVSPEKTEGPCSTLAFLGIEIDSVAGEIRLPQEKLSATFQLWMSQSDTARPRTSGRKRELLSLVGQLAHAATVVCPGRPFLHGLIDASSSVKELGAPEQYSKG
jgi:hypothetical protein